MDIAKESVYWIFRILIVGVLLVILISMLGSISEYKVEDNEVKSYVIGNKVILDEDCLAYSNNRVELGVIDKSKFNKIHLNNCLNTNKGIRLNLTYNKVSELVLINENLADKIDFCYDEETFSCIRKEFNLILKDNLNEIPAKLIMDIVTLK